MTKAELKSKNQISINVEWEGNEVKERKREKNEREEMWGEGSDTVVSYNILIQVIWNWEINEDLTTPSDSVNTNEVVSS